MWVLRWWTVGHAVSGLHWYGFNSAWMFMLYFSAYLLANSLSHVELHLWDFSPVCNYKCFLKSPMHANIFWGFSPVWTCMCLLRLLHKRTSHIVYICEAFLLYALTYDVPNLSMWCSYSLAAYVAFERIFSSMSSHVHPQNAWPIKLPLAFQAYLFLT